MPSKSPHPRGKHPHQSKKSKTIQRREALAASPPAPERPARVAEPAAVPAPRPAAALSRQRTTSYPYIYGELRRIGVLATMMIIILIILAVVVP